MKAMIVYLIVIGLVIIGLRAFSPAHQSILKDRIKIINQFK